MKKWIELICFVGQWVSMGFCMICTAAIVDGWRFLGSQKYTLCAVVAFVLVCNILTIITKFLID